MAKQKRAPRVPRMVNVYLQCRFCQHVENLPLVEIAADPETGRMTTVSNMTPMLVHMQAKHSRRLEQLAEESEPEEAEAEKPAPLVGPGDRGPEAVRQEGVLGEMGSQQIPAAFRMPGPVRQGPEA